MTAGRAIAVFGFLLPVSLRSVPNGLGFRDRFKDCRSGLTLNLPETLNQKTRAYVDRFEIWGLGVSDKEVVGFGCMVLDVFFLSSFFPAATVRSDQEGPRGQERRATFNPT